MSPNQRQEPTPAVHETLDQPKTVDQYERNKELLNVFKQKLVQLKQDVSELASPSRMEK